jgi:ribosomal protein L31
LLEELLSDEAAYGQQLHTLCHVRTHPTTIGVRSTHTHSTLRVHVQSFYHPYLANAKLAEKPGRAEAEIMFHRVDEVPLVGVWSCAMIVSTLLTTALCSFSHSTNHSWSRCKPPTPLGPRSAFLLYFFAWCVAVSLRAGLHGFRLTLIHSGAPDGRVHGGD